MELEFELGRADRNDAQVLVYRDHVAITKVLHHAGDPVDAAASARTIPEW